jgi:hypothetical protein
MNHLAAHSPGEIFAAYLTAILLAVVATMIIGALAAIIRLRLRDRRDRREAAALESARSVTRSVTTRSDDRATATVAPSAIRIRLPEAHA